MTQQASRIFVTGVAGMIGSNTARSLLAQGHAVVGIDNLWRGTKANIADLLTHPGFSFRHADIVADQDWYRDLGAQDAGPLTPRQARLLCPSSVIVRMASSIGRE